MWVPSSPDGPRGGSPSKTARSGLLHRSSLGRFLERRPPMANKNLFSGATSVLPRADTLNEAGGRAYALPPKHALAQLAATGCFNGAFYSEAQAQLAEVLALAGQVDDTFLAKLAVYS